MMMEQGRLKDTERNHFIGIEMSLKVTGKFFLIIIKTEVRYTSIWLMLV